MQKLWLYFHTFRDGWHAARVLLPHKQDSNRKAMEKTPDVLIVRVGTHAARAERMNNDKGSIELLASLPVPYAPWV